MNVLRSLPVRSGDIACFGSFIITRYKEIPCCRCTQFFSVIQCSDAVMRMGLWVLMLVENCVSSEDYSIHPRHHGVTGGEK